MEWRVAEANKGTRVRNMASQLRALRAEINAREQRCAEWERHLVAHEERTPVRPRCTRVRLST